MAKAKAAKILTHDHTAIVGQYAYSVRIFDDRGTACTFRRRVNPRTGEGWQGVQQLQSHPTKVAGMQAWLVNVTRARRKAAAQEVARLARQSTVERMYQGR